MEKMEETKFNPFKRASALAAALSIGMLGIPSAARAESVIELMELDLTVKGTVNNGALRGEADFGGLFSGTKMSFSITLNELGLSAQEALALEGAKLEGELELENKGAYFEGTLEAECKLPDGTEITLSKPVKLDKKTVVSLCGAKTGREKVAPPETQAKRPCDTIKKDSCAKKPKIKEQTPAFTEDPALPQEFRAPCRLTNDYPKPKGLTFEYQGELPKELQAEIERLHDSILARVWLQRGLKGEDNSATYGTSGPMEPDTDYDCRFERDNPPAYSTDKTGPETLDITVQYGTKNAVMQVLRDTALANLVCQANARSDQPGKTDVYCVQETSPGRVRAYRGTADMHSSGTKKLRVHKY